MKNLNNGPRPVKLSCQWDVSRVVVRTKPQLAGGARPQPTDHRPDGDVRCETARARVSESESLSGSESQATRQTRKKAFAYYRRPHVVKQKTAKKQ